MKNKRQITFEKYESALYPTVVLTICLTLMVIEVLYVIPHLAESYVGLMQDKSALLTDSTRRMMDISEFFCSPVGMLSTVLMVVGLTGVFTTLWRGRKALSC